MTTQEIYNLASELTEQEVINIYGGWEKDNDSKSINTFNSLVSLGDSNKMSCATVIAEKLNYKGDSEMEQIAYTS